MNPDTQKRLLTAKLASAFDKFITLVESFSENQINKIPFEGSWTPAQVATHIILATDGVPDGHTQKSERAIDALLPMIRPWWEDLNQKFQSPEQLRPGTGASTKQELVAELDRIKQKDLAIIEAHDLSAICLDFELPKIGYLTRYEWLHFIEMHLTRHSAQLIRIQKHLAAGG